MKHAAIKIQKRKLLKLSSTKENYSRFIIKLSYFPDSKFFTKIGFQPIVKGVFIAQWAKTH